MGIDPLPDRVAIARVSNPGIQFEVGHAEDLTVFEHESFDASASRPCSIGSWTSPRHSPKSDGIYARGPGWRNDVAEGVAPDEHDGCRLRSRLRTLAVSGASES